MNNFKLYLSRFLAVTTLSLFITALIRSIMLGDWIFVFAYIFIALSYNTYIQVKEEISKKEEVEDYMDSLNKFMDNIDKNNNEGNDNE